MGSREWERDRSSKLVETKPLRKLADVIMLLFLSQL